MKKLVRKASGVGLALLPFLGVATKVLANETISLQPAGSQFRSLFNLTIPGIISALITLALVIAGLVAFGFLVYGGIVWITSGGDKTKTESARNTITAALIGLLIVFAAFAVIQLVQAFFGVSILNLTIEPATNA